MKKAMSVAALLCLLTSCNEFYHKDPPKEQKVCGNAISNSSFSSHGYDGKALFSAYCASCHNPLKNATGPAMKGLAHERDIDWIHKFLTDRTFKPKDERAKMLKAKYGTSCLKFPQLNRDQIEAIFGYAGMR